MERKKILTEYPEIWKIFPVFLYAETHYRFKYFFSLLRKREPEILADAPYRIGPDRPLPLLILVKDADVFNVTLIRVKVSIDVGGSIRKEIILLDKPVQIREKIWWQVHEIPVDGISGNAKFDVLFEISDGKKKKIYNNDNYRTSSHKPLEVYISPCPLPSFENLRFGECHSHSSFSEDQVEFGTPLGASIMLCRGMGLSFFCTTDHSYDLDDEIGNYLKNDPNFPKWHSIQQEIDALNALNRDVCIIRGEEVTCMNEKGKNVHMLLLGNRKFYSGSGDSAEKWFHTKSEKSISDILEDLEDEAISFAAHPKEPVPLLQKLLLKRDVWKKADIGLEKLTGIQIINGRLSDGFNEGYSEWTKILLSGKKCYALAGDDAHGNFNRFRQIGIPFLLINESDRQLFGKMRTAVFSEKIDEISLLRSLKYGRSILTDGPVINITSESEKDITSIGSHFLGEKFSFLLEAKSSIEYGTIESVKVFNGIIGGHENVIFSRRGTDYTEKAVLPLQTGGPAYLRAEVWTSSLDSYDRKRHFCITNPIWFAK